MTHGETNQIDRIEAYLWQNSAVPFVWVEGGGLDVRPVKVPQVQWPLTVPVTEGNQGTHDSVFGWAADGRHCTHLVEVQQETRVILKPKQIIFMEHL